MSAKQIQCPECGGKEFISQPDSYSVYEADGNKLRFVSTELANDEDKLYCRDCSAELDTESVEFV
ncbi:hypothetical protein [Candidatus Mycalebacterium sp.]